MPARRTYIQADGTHADVPLNEQRVRVRIKSRVNQSVDRFLVRRNGGDPPHWQEFVMPKSVLAQAQDLVETDLDKLRTAEEIAENLYQAWIDEHGGKESVKYNRETWGNSVEGVFCTNYRRGIKPFIAVEVLEDNLPPPLMPAQIGVTPRDMDQNTSAILAEMKSMRAHIEKQDKTIEALQSSLAKASRPKRFK